MILLKLFPITGTPGGDWAWVLTENDRKLAEGTGKLSEVPGHAARVQLILPANRVLLTRAQLPAKSRQLTGTVLAFAVEEQLATEPEASSVMPMGSCDGAEVVAVTDGTVLSEYRKILESAGINTYEILCETLLLPLKNGICCLYWVGREGCVRSARLEGFATDTGNRATPPLSLQLRLNEARTQGEFPAEITVHPAAPDVIPDLEQWQQRLGLPVRAAETWSWRTPQAVPAPVLLETRRRWAPGVAVLRRLRPAASVAAAALALHLAAISVHCLWLNHEQRSLRADMESRFRAAFPDAVAVVDPALQMRRKLAEVRHAAGLPDNSDFLPLLDRAAPLISALPAGSLRNMTYGSGRMTMELHALDAAGVEQFVGALQRAGFTVERSGTAVASGALTRIIISAS